MIQIPYSVEFVTTLNPEHPLAKQAIQQCGDALPDVLAEMLVELLDKHFAEMNNGWTWAKVDTLDSIIKETENNLKEMENA